MKAKWTATLLSLVFVAFSAQAQKDKNPAQVFNIDPAHTSVVFGIDHLGFSNVYGMFAGAKGEFSFPADKPEAASLTMEVPAKSINTGVDKRDEHLRSPDFFNVKQYPTISFKSTKTEKLKNGKIKMTGDLSLHGQTKPVSFEFTKFRTGKGSQGETRTGGEARFKIKRSDFGMNFMQGENAIGDDVNMIISIEGVAK